MSLSSHNVDEGSSQPKGINMNADIQGKLDAIKAVFQPILDAADAVPALVDAQELVKYNEGVEAGKAMIVLPDPANPDAQYTQSQMDAAVSSGKEQQASEDQVQIADLGGKLASVQESAAALQINCDALNAKYDDLVAKVKAANADDAALIAGL